MIFSTNSVNNFFNSICIVILTCLVHRSSGEECICHARFVGEYCGNELNEKSDTGTGGCSNELIYFCGKSNMHKIGIPVRACSEKGYQCASKANKENPCFQNLLCGCGPNHRRKKKYCGSELVGPGCKPNIVYKCPLIRGYKMNVEDACPNGCENGRCI